MDKLALVNKALAATGIDPNDTRTPAQKRLDEIIEQNDDIILELQKMNKNLEIVGEALIKMANPMLKVEAEKPKKGAKDAKQT